MIIPIHRHSDYLEFECQKCKEIFHHADEITHDAPATTESLKYDVRNWDIAKIYLVCPKCKDKGSYKLRIMKST